MICSIGVWIDRFSKTISSRSLTPGATKSASSKRYRLVTGASDSTIQKDRSSHKHQDLFRDPCKTTPFRQRVPNCISLVASVPPILMPYRDLIVKANQLIVRFKLDVAHDTSPIQQSPFCYLALACIIHEQLHEGMFSFFCVDSKEVSVSRMCSVGGGEMKAQQTGFCRRCG